MLFDIGLMVLIFYLSIPASVGYFAYSRGRSFWVWFGLGFILPFLAHLVLFLIVTYSDRKKKAIYSKLTPKEERYMEELLGSTLQEIRIKRARESRI